MKLVYYWDGSTCHFKCKNKKDFIASRIRYIFSLLTRFPRFSEQIIIVLTLDEVKKRFNEIMGTTPHQIPCTATVWTCRKWIPIFLTNKNAFVKIIIFRIRVKTWMSLQWWSTISWSMYTRVFKKEKRIKMLSF